MKVFIEEQRFTQVLLHIIIGVSFMIPIILIVKAWIESNGEDTDATIGLLVLVVTILITYILLFSLKLKTRIDGIGIHYRFVPFHFSAKLIPWNEINKAYIRKYNAMLEYGGWGVRSSVLRRKKRGMAYSMKGNVGVQLILKNGKKILIGTQKEDELNRVLQTYAAKIENNEI